MNQNVIVLIKGDKVETWGSLTEVCDQYPSLPYHYLKKMKFPIRYKDVVMIKTPFRGKVEEPNMILPDSSSVQFRLVTDPNGGWLSVDGYSKYNDRWKAKREGKLNDEPIYGLEQARDHAREYFSKEDEYTQSRREKSLTVEKVITITEQIEEINWNEND